MFSIKQYISRNILRSKNPNQEIGDFPGTEMVYVSTYLRIIPTNGYQQTHNIPYIVCNASTFSLYILHAYHEIYHIPYVQESTHSPYGQKSTQLDCSRGSASRVHENIFVHHVLDAQNEHPQQMGYHSKQNNKLHIFLLKYSRGGRVPVKYLLGGLDRSL